MLIHAVFTGLHYVLERTLIEIFTRINEAVEAKSALAEAMRTLQQTEKKLKVMEEDFNKNHNELEKLRLEVVDKRPQKSKSEAGNQTAEGCDSSKQLSMLEKQVSF